MKKNQAIILVISLLILIGCSFYTWQYNLAYHEVSIEAGFSPSPDFFLKKPDSSAVFTYENDVLNTGVPGSYNISIKTRFFKHKIWVHVNDTVAPTAETIPVKKGFGETVKPSDFFKNINDATAVSVEFLNEPLLNIAGTQTVELILTDSGNNTACYKSELTISPIRDRLVWEAGEILPDVSDFILYYANEDCSADLSEVNSYKTGEYKVTVKCGNITDICVLTVSDTVAPVFEVKDCETFTGSSCNADKFVVSVDDVTEVSFAFKTEPDLSNNGAQTVIITACDEGGNVSEKEAVLYVKEDNVPPVITGVHDYSSQSGRNVLFRDGIEVTDNNPEGLKLDIDTGDFNKNIPGKYEITYTATDASGNKTVKKAYISIVGNTYTEDELWKYVDPVLESLVKEGMSQRELVSEIYNYVKKNLRYYGGESPKLEWLQGAIDAFCDKSGDCYMYACMSKALMDRAGIPNVLIERSETATERMGATHFWNLVNPDDEGWLHYDSLPVSDGAQFLLCTEKEIERYENVWKGYHEYDHSKYPEAKAE